MAWFGDGLSSLSNLKGQITNFTKEVLSEGIVEEIDDRSRQLEETSRRCVELQEVLNSKDAEIALLRRQNCELQKTVVEFNTRLHEAHDNSQDDGGGFFWDPPTVKNQEVKKSKLQQLQDELAQATVRTSELEEELEKYQRAKNDNKEDIADGNRKAELLRTKQDTVNRIIQIGEKGREAERNMKKLQLDEMAFVNDFRAAISKLDSPEQKYLIRCALNALDIDNGANKLAENEEKNDEDEKGRLTQSKISIDDATNSNGVYSRENQLKNKIKKLQEENQHLLANMEELDRQHVESIEKILALKDELQKKHQCLQSAYESLYADYNKSQSELTTLKDEIERIKNSNVKKINETVQTEFEIIIADKTASLCAGLDVEIQTDFHENLEKAAEKMKEIINVSNIGPEIGETWFECVARNFVEVEEKKNLLEHRLGELTRELDHVSEMKESLQLECDELQSTVESLDMELIHAKTNLPSIPEVSEEKIASLESESDSMTQEIKRLQSECEVLRNKNCELITAISNVEGSLRNQENLEAEVRNTKQQLDLAEQQLAGASKNVENNENMMEDLRRRLHVSLDENNDLRKRIDTIESTERQINEQLTSYINRCKSLEEDVSLFDELKINIENTRRELSESIEKTKQLECELLSIVDGKRELEQDILVLSREKEQLEVELSILQESGIKNENSDVLKELRKQLEDTTSEKNDLAYDLKNMRKELDLTLNERSTVELQCHTLAQENEKLTMDNCSLSKQLKSSNEEWHERHELLQNEINLLQQEHAFLQEEAATDKLELKEAQIKLDNLESKNLDYEKVIQATRSECESLKSTACTIANLEEKLELTEKNFNNSTIKYKQQEIDIIDLENKFEKCLNDRLTAEKKFQTLESHCQQLEAELTSLKTENTSLRASEDFQEGLQQLRLTIDAKQAEIQALESVKAELTAKLMLREDELLAALEKSTESAAMAKGTIENLSELVKQKDEELKDLKISMSEDLDRKTEEFEAALTSVKSERDELVQLVQVKHAESLQYHAEIQRLTQLFNEQTAALQAVIVERELQENLVKEKESQILWGQNELEVVRQRLKKFEESNNYGETCNIVEHSMTIAQASILNEKCNALEAALLKEQSNNRLLQDQLTDSIQRETCAAKELERLRSHLVEIEANHTEEALLLEHNKKELEAKVLQAEEKLKNNSTVYTSANIRANQQVETLQQQMTLIIQQRDEIQNKLSAAEDKVLSHTASLTNLQIVLEQFQRDKENDIRNATEKIREQLKDSFAKQEELSKEIINLKAQLSEAKECLLAASRLSAQLDKKSERIRELNDEVAKLTELGSSATQRIEEAQKSGEGKVDKSLMKNLLLGFLSSPASDKSSVLRVFSTILDFNEAERDKAGLNHPSSQGGWFSGLLSNTGSTKDQESSLSAAFVRFLESESKPVPPIPPLPISNTNISRPGHSRQHSTSSSQSGLLLSNITLPSFPDFVPSRNTGSILKEVLKDS